MSYTLVSECDSKWNVFELAVELDTGGQLSVYVTADEADSTALKMSMLHPGKRVTLESLARIKAAYIDGKRISLNDYKSFYTNLTEEQYRNTLIRDATTAEWV